MIWLRIAGLVLSVAGVLSVALIPMWGSGASLAAIGLILVGIVLLAFGTRRTQFRDSTAGGPYADASGADMGDGGFQSHGGHDGGHSCSGYPSGGLTRVVTRRVLGRTSPRCLSIPPCARVSSLWGDPV